jgi:PDZ domain
MWRQAPQMGGEPGPRPWWPGAAGGLLALAVVAASSPAADDAEQVRRMVEDMQRASGAMRPAAEQTGWGCGGGLVPGPLDRLGWYEARLGVVVEEPGAALAEQLDLPRGQGLVVRDVQAGSAAARAGVRDHDVLLELGGRPVPRDAWDFARAVARLKADTPVDAVVLRRGKRESVPDLTLPEEQLGVPLLPYAGPSPPAPRGLAGTFSWSAGTERAASWSRTNDRFTARYTEGELAITLTGTLTDGKARVREIRVRDRDSADKYDSLDQVPERYRDRVKDLIGLTLANPSEQQPRAP